MEKKLIENGKGFIDIYFNLIIKYLPYILKKCTIETVKNRDSVEEFESKFKKFIEVCLDNYQDYSLNFIDTK